MALAVHGMSELNRTFKHAPKDVRRAYRAELRTVGEPVRSTAERLAVSRDPQGRARSGRGCGSGSRSGSSTSRPASAASRVVAATGCAGPSSATLLMERAMEPALEQNRHRIEEDFDQMLDRLVRSGITMARKLVVEIVGDASSLDRAFKKASRSAKNFDKRSAA